MNIKYGYCHCGCGGKTAISKHHRKARGIKKGEPVRYIKGHARTGVTVSEETRERMKNAQLILAKDPEHTKKISIGKTGVKQTKEHTANNIRAKTGKDPTYSPFIEHLIIRFDKGANRWCCSSPIRKSETTHAKAVWEHFKGEIPKDYRVHHKNGDATKYEYDHIDNLMLLSNTWNMEYMPKLAKGFNIPEYIITEAYIKFFKGIEDELLFYNVCKELIKIKEQQYITNIVPY